MEHAQPLDRAFPWRPVVLAASVLALGAGSVVALVDRPAAPAPAAAQHQIKKAPALPPLRPRSRISVLVLNGNGVSGAAGTEATQLLTAGYAHAIPTNGTQMYATSLVLFRRGWQGEAQRLAHELKIRTVAALDGSLPGADAREQLVVILGAK